jgi:hypothetical protein
MQVLSKENGELLRYKDITKLGKDFIIKWP